MSNVDNVKLFINDTGGVFFTDNHVLDHMNKAHINCYIDSQTHLTTYTWTLTSNSNMVDLPSSVMIPKYVEYDDKVYWVASEIDLEQYSANWRSETNGQPKWFIRWDHNHIRVWPKPDQTYVVKLVGTPWPTEIALATNSSIGIDRDYDKAVEHLACSGLLEFGRPDLSQIHLDEAKNAIYNYRKTVRNNQKHNIRRLHPATRLNKAQAGKISIGRLYK